MPAPRTSRHRLIGSVPAAAPPAVSPRPHERRAAGTDGTFPARDRSGCVVIGGDVG